MDLRCFMLRWILGLVDTLLTIQDHVKRYFVEQQKYKYLSILSTSFVDIVQNLPSISLKNSGVLERISSL